MSHSLAERMGGFFKFVFGKKSIEGMADVRGVAEQIGKEKTGLSCLKKDGTLLDIVKFLEHATPAQRDRAAKIIREITIKYSPKFRASENKNHF